MENFWRRQIGTVDAISEDDILGRFPGFGRGKFGATSQFTYIDLLRAGLRDKTRDFWRL